MLCVESPCKPSLAQSEVCISDFDSAVLKRGVEWGSLHPSLRVYEVSKPFATHEGMWFAFLVNDKSSGKTHKSSTINNWRILAVSNDGKRVKQIQHINPLADFVESWPIGKSAIQLVVEQSEQGLSTRQQYQVDLETQRCISITDPQLLASNEKLHPSLWSFPPINFAGSSQLFARPQIFRARFYDEYQRDSVSSITKGFEESTCW